MEPKVVNREVKTITTLKYDDGSTKNTEYFKAYSNEIDEPEMPVFVYHKVDHIDKNGNFDEEKSSFYRETLCIPNGKPIELTESDLEFEDSETED